MKSGSRIFLRFWRRLLPDELAKVDLESDRLELTCPIEMGAVRAPHDDEDSSGYGFLTRRKRPGWIRRSRLVAREFRTWTPWTQELFAPASSLAVVHSVLALAMSKGLEVVTLDIKDAYLNVPQKAPVIIEVDAQLLGDGTPCCQANG